MHKTLTISSFLLVFAQSLSAALYVADFSNTTTLVTHETGSEVTSPGSVSGPNFDVSWSGTIGTDTSANFWETDGSQLKGSDWGGVALFQTHSIDVMGWNSVEVVNVGTADVNSTSEYLTWSYSLDSGSLVQISTVTGDTGANYDHGYTQQIDTTGVSSLIVQFETNFNGSSDYVTVNSLSVNGLTAVPEPSIVVTVFAVIAIGLAALRRSRN